MQNSESDRNINNYIYLFELDSVRKSNEECIKGREALFLEIMNGNIVVLSYNQVSSLIINDRFVGYMAGKTDQKSHSFLVRRRQNLRF